jgi:hypothetical protein
VQGTCSALGHGETSAYLGAAYESGMDGVTVAVDRKKAYSYSKLGAQQLDAECLFPPVPCCYPHLLVDSVDASRSDLDVTDALDAGQPAVAAVLAVAVVVVCPVTVVVVCTVAAVVGLFIAKQKIEASLAAHGRLIFFVNFFLDRGDDCILRQLDSPTEDNAAAAAASAAADEGVRVVRIVAAAS